MRRTLLVLFFCAMALVVLMLFHLHPTASTISAEHHHHDDAESLSATTTAPSARTTTSTGDADFFTVRDPDADAASFARTHHWTLVVGIPSVDREYAEQRRQLQRQTWMRYSAVSSSSGSVLTRYLLGLHPSHEYKISAALAKEIDAERDVFVLNLREGKPSTAKTSGGGGYWGLEAEVSMSRKNWFWWNIAHVRYDADFFAKADDDLFLRANIVAAMLRGVAADERLSKSVCPRLYWGKVMKWGARKNDPSSRFPFAGGMFILMSRVLVSWVVASDAAAVNNREPYHGDKARYKSTNHDHEDVMVGRWLYNARLDVCVAADCRFHDVHVGANKAPVRASSLGIHHLRPDEYHAFMRRYPDAANGSLVLGTARAAVERLRGEPLSKRYNDGHAKLFPMC